MKTNPPYTQSPGFTLVETMITVAIISLLVAIAVPNYTKVRATSHQNACISNLRQLDSAVQQWAVELNKTSTDSYDLTDTTLLSYLKGTVVPLCPAGGVYSAGAAIGDSPACSLSGIQGHSL